MNLYGGRHHCHKLPHQQWNLLLHQKLHEKSQGIKISGISAQFQNGAVENAIKSTVAKVHTMMLHSALQWPDPANQNLWLYPLSHAAYLHNIHQIQTQG